jgi:hypothetical protein
MKMVAVHDHWFQIVKEMNDRCPKHFTVRLETKNENGRQIGGKFNLDDQIITLYTEEISRQCQLFFQGDLSALQYGKVILAHELGHALDPQLSRLSRSLEEASDPFHKTRISLLIEANAWKIAKSLLPDVPKSVFSKIRSVSLEHYYNDMTHLSVQAV